MSSDEQRDAEAASMAAGSSPIDGSAPSPGADAISPHGALDSGAGGALPLPSEGTDASGQSSSDSGIPAAGKPPGAACQSRGDCTTGSCVDGVCCQVAACGECQRCNGEGRCASVVSAMDSDSCLGQCDATGRCGLALGERCGSGGLPCLSGQCVDGYCCDSKCDQPCRTCAAAGIAGRCSPVSGLDDPDTCQGTRSCGDGRCAAVDVQSLAIGYGNYFGTMSSGWLRLGQTLTLAGSGDLVLVQLVIECVAPSDRFNLAIYQVGADGMPTQRLRALAEDLTPRDPISEPPRAMNLVLKSFTMSPALRVSAGQRIAIVAEAPGNTDTCAFQSGRSDVYGGGTGLGQHADTLTWTTMPEDFTFRLLVVRP